MTPDVAHQTACAARDTEVRRFIEHIERALVACAEAGSFECWKPGTDRTVNERVAREFRRRGFWARNMDAGYSDAVVIRWDRPCNYHSWWKRLLMRFRKQPALPPARIVEDS